MNEFFSSVKEAFQSRFWSPMYGTFILAWLTTNRWFRFVMLFVDEKLIFAKYGLLKDEYMLSLYSPLFSRYGLRIIAKLLLIPILVTYMIHRQLSKVELKVYVKWLENKNAKKIKKLEEEKKYQQKILESEKKKWDIFELQKENIKKEEEKIKTEEDFWFNSYTELAKNWVFVSAMNKLKKSLYTYSGNIYKFNSWSDNNIIDEDSLALLDANSLIIIDYTKDRVSVTEKWKFYMKKFMEEDTI